MARDAELDRLRAAQDNAFQRKQDAFKIQQDAWNRRSAAREEMNRAFERKRQVIETLNRAWECYQSIRNANGSRIDLINSDQERAYYNMKSSFESASSAYERGDGASASSYAREGHYYKERAQSLVAERRRLVAEIQSAREAHEAIKPEFQRLKDDFNSARRYFDSAKAEHEHAREAFKRAKAEFDSCAKAFKARLDELKSASQKRRKDKKSLAEKAGVPSQYRDNIWISKDSDGNTNIYFGGVDKPDGPGHGHYVMDRNGNVTYRREPFNPHGAQNFTEAAQWQKVKMSLDRDSGHIQTDNYIGVIGDRNQKTKAHIAVDSDGDIVYVRDIGGEVLYDKKHGIGHLPDDLDWSS